MSNTNTDIVLYYSYAYKNLPFIFKDIQTPNWTPVTLERYVVKETYNKDMLFISEKEMIRLCNVHRQYILRKHHIPKTNCCGADFHIDGSMYRCPDEDCGRKMYWIVEDDDSSHFDPDKIDINFLTLNTEPAGFLTHRAY